MNSLSRGAAAVLLCTAMCSAKGQIAADPGDCRLQQLGSIDLVVDGQILVPVTVAGHQGLMVLNVGDGLTVLWQDFVGEARLPVRRFPAVATFNSHEITKAARVGEIKMGSVTFDTSWLYVSPPVWASRTETGGMPIIGALGMDLFSEVDFELDVARLKLNLFSQDHCRNRVVYWTHDYASVPLNRDALGNASITMEFEGRKIEAILMFTSEITTLHSRVARRVFGFDTAPDRSSDRFIAMRITAPGLTATNMRVSLTSAPGPEDGCTLLTSTVVRYRDCVGAYPMEVGRNILQALRLYFATKERVLYFSTANATK